MFKLYKLTENDYKLATLLFIFDHTIVPILLYGSEAWGLELAKFNRKNKNDNFYFESHLDDSLLTSLEIKFYKRLLKVRRNTSTMAVRGELGRYPISIKAVNRAVKFYNQTLFKPEKTLVKQALNESIELHNKG